MHKNEKKCPITKQKNYSEFKYVMCYYREMKKYFLQFLTMSVFSIYSVLSSAHGEDKPGPHEGHIRMPGAFHTEVVITTSQKIKVYLLDMNWQNPVVKNSNIQVTYKSKRLEKAACSVTSDHFTCEFSKKVDLTKKGTLNIEAEREGNKGATAIYELPLSHHH